MAYILVAFSVMKSSHAQDECLFPELSKYYVSSMLINIDTRERVLEADGSISEIPKAGQSVQIWEAVNQETAKAALEVIYGNHFANALLFILIIPCFE